MIRLRGTPFKIAISMYGELITLSTVARVIRMIFDEKEARKNKAEIIIKCSFLEIYNEELHDLLERNISSSTMVNQIMPQKKEINIREEKNGTISVYGLKEMTVNSAEEMAGCLDMGSSQRVTACTLMNSSSSRSKTLPLGLWGELRRMQRVRGPIAAVSSSGSKLNPSPRSVTIFSCAPAMAMLAR